MVMLMLIGGAPGSTAGGMKMTTIAVLLLSTAAVFRRKEDAQCFGRRIPTETVRYAAVVMLMYMVLCTVGGLFYAMQKDCLCSQVCLRPVLLLQP